MTYSLQFLFNTMWHAQFTILFDGSVPHPFFLKTAFPLDNFFNVTSPTTAPPPKMHDHSHLEVVNWDLVLLKKGVGQLDEIYIIQ